MIYVLVFVFVFAAIASAAVAIGSGRRHKAQVSLGQLEVYDTRTFRRAELAAPAGQRLWTPFVARLAQVARWITPVGRIDRMRDRVESAGRPWNLDVNGLLAIKVATLLVGLVLVIIVASLRLLPTAWLVVLGIVIGIVAYYSPDLMLRSWLSERRRRISRGLPDLLDLLTVTVEAGLGLDSALAKIAEKLRDPLREEILITLHHMRMGGSREEALRELARRCDVDDMKNFVSALNQSQRLGVSLGKVLRVQADTIRLVRRQRIEEKAQKVPVKMLMPLMLCIFPLLFIVILGPAVIRMYQALTGM